MGVSKALLALGRRSDSRSDAGQMTVEFVAAFPALVLVAVIAVNAGLFLSECAAFDRAACEAVRVHATSLAFGATADEACGAIGADLAEGFSRDYLATSVESVDKAGGLMTYAMTLEFSPTLFGTGLKTEVFGVSLPKISHRVEHTVDPYKPGVFL